MEVSWAERVKGIRRQMGVNQQVFGALIGVSVRSVSDWERGRAVPNDLRAVILELLSRVVAVHPRAALLEALRQVGPESVALVCALAWLQRNSLVVLPPSFK